MAQKRRASNKKGPRRGAGSGRRNNRGGSGSARGGSANRGGSTNTGASSNNAGSDNNAGSTNRGGIGRANGGRQLVRWTDDLDIHLLLTIQYACNANGVRIPWARVAETMGTLYSEGAIVQHLSKLRARRVAEGLPVSPPLRRSAAATAAAAAAADAAFQAQMNVEAAAQRARTRRAIRAARADVNDDTDDSGLFVDDDNTDNTDSTDSDPDYGTSIRAPKRPKNNSGKAKNAHAVQSGSEETTAAPADNAIWGPMPGATSTRDPWGMYPPRIPANTMGNFSGLPDATTGLGRGGYRVEYPSSGPSPFDWAVRSQQQGATGASTASTQEAANPIDWNATLRSADVLGQPTTQPTNPFVPVDPAMTPGFFFSGGEPAPSSSEAAYPDVPQWYGTPGLWMGHGMEPSEGENQEVDHSREEQTGDQAGLANWGCEDAFADLDDDEEVTFGEKDSKFE